MYYVVILNFLIKNLCTTGTITACCDLLCLIKYIDNIHLKDYIKREKNCLWMNIYK